MTAAKEEEGKKQVLREFFEVSSDDIITENVGDDQKDTYIKGTLQRAGVKNSNGRIYPKEILEREYENYQKLIRDNRSVGELDHPEREIVWLKNASHMITEMWWNENDIEGRAKVLSTPKGKILEGLLEDDVKVGISSRGLGSTRQTNEGTIVEDDYQLVCFDIVSDPSTDGAFMLQEQNQYADPRKVQEQCFTRGDRVNRIFNKILRG